MYYLSFILNNLCRNKARNILTFLAIVVAFLLFGLLRSLGTALDRGADIAGEDRLIATNKVSLIQPLPYNYLQKVRALPGIERATLSNWFGAYYQDKHNQFPQFAVAADDYLELYKDSIALPPEQRRAWQADRIGAIVGRDLATQFHWKVGDRIPLVSMFSQANGSTTWEFVIAGIFEPKGKSVDSGSMFFHYDYFDKARRYGQGNIGWMIVKVRDPKQSVQVAAAIDALFANSFAETKTSSEKDFAKSFAKQFGDIGLITSLILGAVFFTMLLITANTMSQSFRERIAEFAVLKTLGFADKMVLGLVLAESALFALAGGICGLGLAKLLLAVAADSLAGTLPGLVMSPSIVAWGLLCALALGLVTGAGPGIQGLRLNIVTALRRTVQ
jgi:putative ABC transport system permease protein